MSAIALTLPPGRIATAPPEARGARRDDALLLVAERASGALRDERIHALDRILAPSDLLVVNDSAVVPARLETGEGLVVHLSTRAAGTTFVVELRRPCGAGSTPYLEATAGLRLTLQDAGRLQITAPFAPAAGGTRLWLAELDVDVDPFVYAQARGRPIRYGCADFAWPLAVYQTMFARNPGSAESPSAGLGFTPELVARLRARGVEIAAITLHTGVSSQDAGEPPYGEWFRVDADAAAAVAAARARGGRVIAVGTTATRALESAADVDGRVRPASGVTELVITPERGVRAIDGLLTGWHEPEASHLELLEAVAGADLAATSYDAALAGAYRWHEFGDFHLVLAPRERSRSTISR